MPNLRKAILDLPAQLQPELIVTGIVSRDRAKSHRIDTTALQLLSRLDRSILPVEPDEVVCPTPGE